MKNKRLIFIAFGAFIYIVISLVDRYLLSISNMFYIPMVVIAILFMLVGIIKQRQG